MYGNNRSKFAENLLGNEHEIGPMESILHNIHITNKGKVRETEKFYIYIETETIN
jgi:hypothetical protein